MTFRTKIFWGRELSDAEKAIRDSKIGDMTNEGIKFGPVTVDPDTKIGSREFEVKKDADNWIKFLNSAFDPAPISAKVE